MDGLLGRQKDLDKILYILSASTRCSFCTEKDSQIQVIR